MPPIRLADPRLRHPMRFADGTANPSLVHLACVIDHPNISVGDWTYANDFDPPETWGGDWAARLAPYLYRGAPERLRIGPFCQIAHGVRFVTASANHPMDGLSTYPFAIFDPAAMPALLDSLPDLPDTVVGPDCWIGHGATLLPGARLGAGVIVGAGAVVAGEVPPYAVVAGNPARIVRRRFEAGQVDRLLALAWWDWDDARIAASIDALEAGDLAALERG